MTLLKFACAAAGALTLSACSPKFDWREVRGGAVPYVAVLPAKPTTLSRPIDLDGVQVAMTMTAAEVDGVTFAIGSAEMPDAMQAQAALNKMKTALVKNINGSIQHEKSSASGAIDIETGGSGNDGQARRLFARFVANDKRIYQVLVVGPEKKVSREAVDTFFTSFKLN